uniref:Laminin, alpha 5 n=1 Tax=Scleropages formosus TaxID=113540 RepID=A0A8C9WEB0_SCLFO
APQRLTRLQKCCTRRARTPAAPAACAVRAQELPTNGVNGFSLHPPYFNLAEGTKITATATCGEDSGGRPVRDLYCKLVGGPVSGDPGQTIQGQYCDICTMSDSNRAHPITNAIDGTERWWQSPPLSRSAEFNEVNVTLDLGQLFHVAYVLIKFANSPRPDLWVLERSVDFGKNYQPWQFFASSKRDCIERFGWISVERINKDDDVICTTEYSRIVPLENGEIVVSLVNGRPGAMNFSYSPALRDFTKATNIRLRFLRTNTLLGHLMGKALRDPTVTRRYYYSIKDISIGGRCVCNGHAEACNAKDPNDPYRLQCDCQHNTCGASCDQCCPGFNQMPWKPATTDSANECEPCNCNKHALDCYYDPEVEQRRASVDLQGQPRGGGVCLDCQHHTAGVNCERCVPGYYRSPDHPLDSLFACSRESRHLLVSFTSGCDALPWRKAWDTLISLCGHSPVHPPTTMPCGSLCFKVGTCACESEFTDGTYCECNAAGTEGNSCRPDPRSRTCVCKPGFVGAHCDSCAPGFFGLNCQECQCHGPGCLDGTCDTVTGQCHCRGGFQGYLCDQCSLGYFNYPLCQLCGCSSAGSLPAICDASGRCLCRPEFQGPRCEQCQSGFHSYPSCQECSCDPRGSLGSSCSATGHCHCRPNFSGASCDQCASGYYGFPSCTPCQCSAEGSHSSACDQVTGQCTCLPNVVGQRCDSCRPGSYGFPLCQGIPHLVVSLFSCQGSCECRPYVEGAACDKCKPLYWNLSPDTPYGCSSCECNTDGTLSGVAECVQTTGQCHCKANVCSGTCAVCKDGYFNLHGDNYFGCQGCQCDIGGSAGLSCGERNGRCRCRPNVEGQKCNQPRTDHYFPDLHHLKFEIEDGTTVDGRPVRFGYNHLEFGDFSWRGYAQMSSVQPKVVVSVSISTPDLFHMVLRFVNRGSTDVHGRISVLEDGKNFLCGNCSDQSKQIIFAPTSDPTFVNVPQNSFVQPFVLNPGTWTVVIEAEGVLLDYLVLLPSAYYEAPILQIRVTEPCMYSPPEDASQNCLLYKYLSLDGFPTISGNDASCRSNNHLPRPCHTEKVTPRHPTMAVCRGSDTPSQSLLLKEGQASSVQDSALGAAPQPSVTTAHSAQRMPHVGPLAAADNGEHIRLDSSQVQMDRSLPVLPRMICQQMEGIWVNKSGLGNPTGSLSAATNTYVLHCYMSALFLYLYTLRTSNPKLVHTLGRYVFILHYHQPLHPTFVLQVFLNGGRVWQGYANATFCPHGYGCRSLIISENQIILDVTDHEILLTIQAHGGRMLWLDYVLVVPEDRYSSNYLAEEPLDKSYDFISNCGQNSFYIHPTSSSQFCRTSAASLSAFFNNGALPCACHEVGAYSDACEAFGGQCRCLPHVIGRDCSQCATGYWGFPNCRPCECGIRLCEPVTGECICPPRTVRPDCVQCEPQTFGCHPLVGCEVCNCSRPGVTAQDISCDTDSGQCRCKNNIVGRRCDRCAPGFYGYPNCRLCDCNEAGTESDICDARTGRCLCKENVEGAQCDQCRVGTFHLDPTNPKGCTSCFCFGATDRCRSSEKRWTEFMDMRGWTLLGGDRQEVPVSTDVDKSLVEADLRDVPDVYQDLHWHAPHSYLGDKVSSYGGYLRYYQHSQTQPTRGDMLELPPEASRPDVILKVHQGSFRHSQTGNPVSREELMMVLVALEALQIRALHSQSSLAVTLRRVVLESASQSSTGKPASNVEMCLCPANYKGDSCQQCAPGYYRDTKGLFLGKCVPCNCNGHSDQCLDGSGICVNCQHNTAGDHCEKCQGGFLDNGSLDGHAVSCSSCPCPLQVTSNNFAVRCVEKPNHMQCLCMPGYAGPKCERCAPGFYGNPMVIGSTCQPCQCHDNTDPNMLFSDCHPLTGVCQGCMHNTTGPYCEVCAPGFYGDAITAKNCTRCNCSPCGTASCDPRSGECHCKPGVTGARCDHCETGSFGFETCGGCQRCNCDAAAALIHSCDPRNGTCACQPGVNGPHCRQCAPGYWGYSPNGCMKCECKTGLCDPRTGECTCSKGLTGKQCDTCVDRYSVLVEIGEGSIYCQRESCDSCVIVLLKDLENMNNRFLADTSQITNLNASSIAWAQLRNISQSINATAANRTSVNETNKGTVEDLSEKLSQVEEMLRDMRFKGFQHQKDVADTELATAQKLLERVKEELVSRLADNQALVQKIRDRLGKFHAELMDLRDALNQAVNNTARAAETNNINAKRLEENLVRGANLWLRWFHLIHLLQFTFLHCEHLAAQLDGARLRLAEKVQRFASATSKIALVEKAEEHAEMLNQLAKNLSSVISDTNQDGFIQRAVNASRAYSNIIEAIQKAENAAHEAYDQKYNAVVKFVKHVTFKDITEFFCAVDLKPQLQKARTRLKEAKNKQLMFAHVAAHPLSTAVSSEETAKDIADAKQAAEKANATATQVEDMLSPMKKQLDEWQKQYGNSNATGEDISKAFLEANKSVGMLGETIPLLIKKLDKLQNHSMQMPNISENIERIRELIAQARRAASKVNVPVKFNGTAGVQVRNPQNLADLAAYTSLKLYITLPESSRKTHQADTPSQFVFYLGNKNANKEFLGMMLEGKKLRWVYNLGADTAEVMVDQDILSDGSFNSVSMHLFGYRTLQYGQMAITSEGLVKTVTKADVEAGGDLGLLNLPTEETVFYVGGYPDSFDPPPQLKLPGFQGCIELDTLNEEVLSLYNFERTFQLNTTEVKPCGRTKPVLTQPWVNDGAYFDGTGYAEIAFGEGQRRFEQEARVLSHNGILLLFLDKDRFLCLAVRQGMLKLYWKFNVLVLHLKVELIILQRSGVPQQVLVRSNRFILFRKSYNQTIPSFSGSYFLGGVPADRLPDSLKPLFPDKGSIKGCFRNIKAHSSHIDLKVMNTSGVSYGCSPDLLVAREAHFTGQSYLNLRLEDLPDLQSNFYTGFGFHTEQRNGLMFHHQAQDGVCQVYLDKGHIVARSGKNQVKTQKTYNDANRHYVALYSNNKGVRLYIDDMLEKGTDSSAADSNNAGLQAGSVYLGGTPEALNLSNLTGCISNLFVRR